MPVFDIVNAGPRHRFTTASHTVHNCLGLGYGCGKDKFVVVAKTLAGLEITPQESAVAVQTYRRQNPKITALWNTLQAAITRAAGEPDRTLTLNLPSGNRLIYRGIKNSGNGNYEARLCKGGRMLWCKQYGAQIVENLTQHVARDIFATQLLEIRKQGIPLVLQTHDEAVVEVNEHFDAGVVVGIMSTCPDWIPNLPLAAEASEGKNYCL